MTYKPRKEIIANIVAIADELSYFNLSDLVRIVQQLQQIDRRGNTLFDALLIESVKKELEAAPVKVNSL